jgi:hypothetical protein
MAECFVNCVTNVSAAARARIAPWEAYARRLGDNPYDRYGVILTMRALFDLPFMRASNPEPGERLKAAAAQFDEAANPEVREALRQWQSSRPRAGTRRPITGLVARVLVRQKKFAEALDLFEIASRAVPEYSSLHLEFVCLALECKEQLEGKLSTADCALAAREIQQGQVLIQRGFSESGLAEWYMGRLRQLRGEDAEAIPLLEASRRKLSGLELVAAEHALIVSFLKTGAVDRATKLAQSGVDRRGQFEPLYRNMLMEIERLRAGDAPATK